MAPNFSFLTFPGGIVATCPYCRATIPVEARKCMHCGEWVSSSQQEIPGESGNVLEIPPALPTGKERISPEPLWTEPRWRSLRKPGSKYDLGGNAFGAGLIGLFVYPP